MTFTPEQEKFLLRIVRETCQAKLDGKALPNFKTEAEALGLTMVPGGCFTTFENKGHLRGCIGIFHPDQPLWKIVRSRALETLEDERFVGDEITAEEFPDIDISISVLTKPKPITDPLKEVVVGVHGIWVAKGYHRGTYLPQVATEQGWDTKTFVTHCAKYKAGIRGDVLNDKEIKWATYTATIVKEKKE